MNALIKPWNETNAADPYSFEINGRISDAYMDAALQLEQWLNKNLP